MSTTETMQTSNPDVLLIAPDIERDAPLGVQWLEGEVGRNTLRLMGVTDTDNKPTTLEIERERVRGFIENEKHLNWMIQLDDKVVGTIWVDLIASDDLKAPSLHIMIGDSSARGRGVGGASTQAVIQYLHNNGTETIYSRHLIKNEGSARLLKEAGFVDEGEPYEDKDNLLYQNVILHPSKEMSVPKVAVEHAKSE